MNRKEFINTCLRMGIGLPLLSPVLAFLEKKEAAQTRSPRQEGKFLIIGAGAAGMAAGYLLHTLGYDFTILEAANRIGGRIKKQPDFADFPIDLGAEWIHTHPRVLSEILRQEEFKDQFGTMDYSPQSIQTWKNGKLQSHNYLKAFYGEWKFKRSTWFDFFEKNVLPPIQDRILLGKAVREIDYSGESVKVRTEVGETFSADQVLITCSIKVLQSGMIRFLPELPEEKASSLQKIYMGEGIKVFVSFRECFYPDFLMFGPVLKAISDENKFYYNASFGKDSDHHVLGLLAINEKALPYLNAGSDAELIRIVLEELDSIFGGKASQNYLKHLTQNWSAEPYIQGAYSYTYDGSKRKIIEALTRPLAGKLAFAGEALSLDNNSMVHGACDSGFAVVKSLLEIS
jgi:monoamine oxidase